jgi:hypothetical protein
MHGALLAFGEARHELCESGAPGGAGRSEEFHAPSDIGRRLGRKGEVRQGVEGSGRVVDDNGRQGFFEADHPGSDRC